MKAWESMRRNHDALLSHLSKVPLFMEPRLDVVTVRFPAVGGLDAAIWVIWACVPTSTLTKPFWGTTNSLGKSENGEFIKSNVNGLNGLSLNVVWKMIKTRFRLCVLGEGV
jgi:hypothetical protein